MTPGRCARGVRAATFAAVCVLLAATGHVLMSARALPGPVLALAFAGTWAVAWALSGRERGLVAVTATSMAVQSALHTVFGWSQSAGSPATGAPATTMTSLMDGAVAHGTAEPGGPAHAAMDHGAVSRVGAALGEMPAAHDMTDMGTSFGMFSAHLLAAFLSGVWMAYGERAVFRLLRAVPLGLFRPLRLLITAFAPVTPDRPRPRTARAGDERAPRRLLLAHCVVSRGPPRVTAVL
ncbi:MULTISPECIES: hypothetical protein [unclassified Streptomyces]|uniref:hypothetical protein n=1 Tax=unclassified Streptomyces TaxID=2593676 RepID=UPI00344C9BEA